MVHIDATLGLLIAAVTANGLLAGATVLLSTAAAIAALTHGGTRLVAPAWLMIAATAGQVALTGLAAPTNHAQRRHPGDPAALERISNRFARLQAARWALNLLALAAAIWTLAASPTKG